MDVSIVLLFIVIIAIIVLVDNIATAIAIIVAMLLLFRTNNTLGITIGETIPMAHQQVPRQPIANATPSPIVTVEHPQVPAPSTQGDPNSLDLYGQFYEKWNQQRRAYTDSHCPAKPRIGTSCAERNYDVDAANTLLWQKRTHDKQRSDGWAAKSADYYAYHYANELDLEESKRWWGRDEF